MYFNVLIYDRYYIASNEQVELKILLSGNRLLAFHQIIQSH
jgi:hypothetical protein